MKNLIILSFLFALFFASCRKEDNPKLPDLVRVPVPALTKDAAAPETIIVSDLDNFVGKVNVDVFYRSDILPKKMDLVIIKNDDKSNVKVLKADITSFPTIVSFTGAELTSLFGSVETCDFFELGVNITTQDSRVYEAFPSAGVPYNPGIASIPDIKTTLIYNTKVEYDPAIYQGNFVPVSDEFGDFLPSDIILLTKIDDTHFSFKSPQVSNALPIIAAVDPETLTVSITQQKIGDFFLWDPIYTNPTVGTIAGNVANKVIPCSKTVSIALDYNVDQGGFGEYILILQKQ